MHTELFNLEGCAISLGDRQITSDKCKVVRFDIAQPNNFVPITRLGSRTVELHEISRPIEIHIDLVSTEINFYDFLQNVRISQKQVKDCSVEELFFAIRQKIKKK